MAVVRVFNAHPRRHLRTQPIARYVRRVLRAEGYPRGEVAVVAVDSRFCRRLNRRYLGHDRVTDVISFLMEEGVLLQGEVYVNLDRARSQAREHEISEAHELARLVIHGTLHLVGYDDRDTRRARRMKAAEERHLGHWFKTQ